MADQNLSDLAVFVRVADAGGFRAAAHRHGVSASSLSDAVQRLEATAGVRLLNRTTRNVLPTAAGCELLDRVRPALAEMTSAVETLGSGDEPAGTLRIDVPGVVARYILPPIVAQFLKHHPRISLEISVNDGLIDAMAAGCAAGIRYEEHLAADMVTVPIGPRRQRYVAVAAPSYLQQYGTPVHPRDLQQHVCIAHMYPGGRIDTWEFERGAERVKIQPSGRLATGSSDVQVAAAVAGLGILFSFDQFVADLVTNGQLVVLLDDWSQVFSGPFLYYPRAHRRDPPLVALSAFLRSQTADL